MASRVEASRGRQQRQGPGLGRGKSVTRKDGHVRLTHGTEVGQETRGGWDEAQGW